MIGRCRHFSSTLNAATLPSVPGAADSPEQKNLEQLMNVIEQTRPEASVIPGVAHSTLASGADGLTELSVWRQTLSPGAATPPHRHECDEVVLCLAGWGEVHSEDRVQRFGPDCTVVLPARQDHQIFNAGPLPLEIIGIFAATPVLTRLPDGTPLDLPWRS